VALRTWHFGKLIILWTWGAGLVALCWYVATDLEPEPHDTAGSIFGLMAIALVFLIPAALSVVTWIWLGGKETRPEEGDAETEPPGG
jgi:hypothetical protein